MSNAQTPRVTPGNTEVTHKCYRLQARPRQCLYVSISKSNTYLNLYGPHARTHARAHTRPPSDGKNVTALPAVQHGQKPVTPNNVTAENKENPVIERTAICQAMHLSLGLTYAEIGRLTGANPKRLPKQVFNSGRIAWAKRSDRDKLEAIAEAKRLVDQAAR